MNAFGLEEYLRTKFDERFNSDFLSGIDGSVHGSIDSNRFYITYKPNDFLVVTFGEEGRETLKELAPILKEVMNDNEPICSYDMVSRDDNEGNVKPTIEWDLNDPEGRIKQIVNGRAFSDKPMILDFKLYNGKEISEYLETKEEEEERVKNAKIYGVYPGNIPNTELVDKLNALSLYLMIDSVGGYIWSQRHAMSHGRIPEVDLTEDQYALEYLVYKTTKFGVELPAPEIDKHVTATESYWKWFNFYKDHCDSLTSQQIEEYVAAVDKGEDISRFMPTGNWNDTQENPQKKI